MQALLAAPPPTAAPALTEVMASAAVSADAAAPPQRAVAGLGNVEGDALGVGVALKNGVYTLYAGADPDWNRWVLNAATLSGRS